MYSLKTHQCEFACKLGKQNEVLRLFVYTQRRHLEVSCFFPRSVKGPGKQKGRDSEYAEFFEMTKEGTETCMIPVASYTKKVLPVQQVSQGEA